MGMIDGGNDVKLEYFAQDRLTFMPFGSGILDGKKYDYHRDLGMNFPEE